MDTSMPTSDDSRRAFAGLEVEFALDGWHRIYAMGMLEKDLNDEDPEIAPQDWRYDANYAGLGGRGDVGRIAYAAEAIYQFGSSVASGSTDSEDISAFSFTAALDWRIEGAAEAVVGVEYMFGSGDPDRGSVTEQFGGNEAGTDDEGFLAFGFVQTGFALFPRVSNLHIVRLGGSVRPLAGEDLFRAFEVGAYLYGYRKDEKSAPISDPRATEDDADIGLELDLFLRWRIASDVGLSVNFGSFMPGDAYLDDDTRNFFSAGLTYSF
jgi:hypothetical protein